MHITFWLQVKRPRGKHSCRWENIKVDLKEGFQVVVWGHLAQDRN